MPLPSDKQLFNSARVQLKAGKKVNAEVGKYVNELEHLHENFNISPKKNKLCDNICHFVKVAGQFFHVLATRSCR